jgi:hypothetical protein
MRANHTDLINTLTSWDSKPKWIKEIKKAFDNQIDLLINILTNDGKILTIKVILGKVVKKIQQSCTIFVLVGKKIGKLKERIVSMLASFKSRSKTKKPRETESLEDFD